MKIANVMRRIVFEEWGGTETAVWNSSLKLHRLGHSIEILATKALCSIDHETKEQIPIRRFDYFYPQLFLKKVNAFILDKKGGSPFSFTLFNYLKKRDFDLIHSHAMGRIGKLSQKAARKKNIPFILTFHGGNYDIPPSEMEEMCKPLKGSLGYGKILEKLLGLSRDLVEQADGIICVGANEYQLLRDKFPHKHSAYIPNGVEVSDFTSLPTLSFRHKYNIPTERKLLLCVSRIDYQKNQASLVPLLKELLCQGQDVHCAIVGFVTSASYLRQIRSEIENHNLQKRFTIVEGLPPKSDLLLSAYKESDLFILPSIHEPFGIVVLEAWSCNLPVIASAVGGLKTLIRSGNNGFLFTLNDIDSMLSAYRKAINNDSIKQNAYKEVLNKYSWDTVSSQILNFYVQAIANYEKK